ncbi:hypothetical protein BS47DRAFT_1396986 [Hydnum rufescens UP504]|uniref:Uncharacterized protein n=1 Tax=Hydnum rufescens UP504 TaxID=1448309 RepID=A0A9P6DSA5_9AGAM|nr:hypothetical protein BS47DRAFT_1396986 [Hydnum rufescens UP504]
MLSRGKCRNSKNCYRSTIKTYCHAKNQRPASSDPSRIAAIIYCSARTLNGSTKSPQMTFVLRQGNIRATSDMSDTTSSAQGYVFEYIHTPAPSPALSMISAGPKTDEDPVFVSLIKKEENKTSEGFWPDSVNTSGAIVKQYNNDESSKVDQLVGLSFQRTLDPRLTLHPFIDNFYPQTRIPLNSPPLSTVQTPLPISQNIAPSNQNAKEENAKRPTTLTAQQLREIFDSSTEPSTRSTRSSFHLSYSPPHPPRAPRNFHKPQSVFHGPARTATRTEHGPLIAKQSLIVNGTPLKNQLSRTIANHNLQMDSLTPPLSLLSATLHQREADLNTKSDVLNKHDLKLLRDEYYVSPGEIAFFIHPRTFTHRKLTAADIIRQEHRMGTPYSAFILHRRIAPALSQLSASLSTSHDMAPAIVTDDRASTYYTVRVRDIQYDLRNNEWDEFKDTTTEFELKELPSNPGIEIVSDDDSSGW